MPHPLEPHLSLLRCPRCLAGGLELRGDALACASCGQTYGAEGGLPRLFWPNDWKAEQRDVTDTVKAFYEETPFPNYDDFDSIGSLAEKARQGVFARLLDEQVPPRARVLEVGCGTGQLSNFLSIANRTVFASDLCVNSLGLGRDFARRHSLANVHFVQMNLFRPAFAERSFDLVVSNGVLHHTSDPFLAYRTIAQLVKPGGFLLVGLYHRYGRLITDARRLLFRLSGDRFLSLDPNLRDAKKSAAKKRAWLADQYKHPHESKHTISQTLSWIEKIGFRFVKSIPRSKPFAPIAPNESLFEAELPGNAVERFLAETGAVVRGSREGGFFIVIAQRP